MKKNRIVWVLSLMSLVGSSWAAEPVATAEPTAATSAPLAFWIQAEVGPVWQTVNDVQIPTSTGTRFSLTDLGTGPVFRGRLYFGYRIHERHEVRALYAPLSIELTGNLSQDVDYQSVRFSKSDSLVGLYRFNSYRLTYRYGLIQNADWDFKIGFTGKIRDAEIKLTQGALSATRTNVGFVPLLHLYFEYRFNEKLSGLVDIDALASPYGRAEDVALQLAYRFNPQFSLISGYRTVEGGSKGGGQVYNFAWLHAFVLGAQFSF